MPRSPKNKKTKKQTTTKITTMRVSNVCVLFVPRSCLECQHFKPIIVGGITKDFGKCGLYIEEETRKLGYANGARLNQNLCGEGATWFSPKKKNIVFIAE
jgi:hypothetical protein